jgi:ABC-type spermidine/putrescine transport system permease subunit II
MSRTKAPVRSFTRASSELTTTGPIMRLYLITTFALLFLPLAVVVVMSFNASPYGTLPFEPTLLWYGQLARQSALIGATLLSAELSAAVALVAAVIGTLLSLWLVRYARRGFVFVNALLVSAVTVPWLILGVAMLLVLNAVGLGRSYTSMFLGSLATSLPYVVFLVVARLQELDPSIEDAARSLGARPPQVLVRVTVPLIAPAVGGGALLAFMVCFNNFIIQYFLAPFGVRTLPLEIYTLVRVGYRPDINALATFIVGATISVVVALQRLGTGTQRLAGRVGR